MLKAVIIDDEPHAREKMLLLLQKYCPEVVVMATAKDATEGLSIIARHQPDLVFLDIEMPVLSGFDLLRQLESINFEIIFATAHDQYAIKAIKFSALDYLIKPIDFEQMQNAVHKAAKRIEEKTSAIQYQVLKENLQHTQTPMEQLAIPAQSGMLFVKVSDILYCEADSNYTHIYFTNKQKIVSSRVLKEYEELLKDNGFIRIHHSHLINRAHVAQYIKGEGGLVILRGGVSLSVSRRKKEEVIDKLKK
jgi:two-component system, LytTR family, response regulator